MTCCRPRKNRPASDCVNGAMNCSAIAVADTPITVKVITRCATSASHDQQPAGDVSGGEIVVTPARMPQFRSFGYQDRSSSSSISLHEGAKSFRLDSCDSCRHVNHRRRKRKHRRDEESHKSITIEDIVQLCKSTFDAVERQPSAMLLEEQRGPEVTNEDRKGVYIQRKLLNDPLTPTSSSRVSP
ncbi:Hypothetical protein GLP15_1792 [Giardia lamblia P15]|uniref:Uncharacterized protein n=1 Tax=Giardia intestinalis (strain P15) TaxID=658858 RepID=E1F389_GIAIA|nr:Hypothetical protein GLP15_1792 [Giardia lamblia P15]